MAEPIAQIARFIVQIEACDREIGRLNATSAFGLGYIPLVLSNPAIAKPIGIPSDARGTAPSRSRAQNRQPARSPAECRRLGPGRSGLLTIASCVGEATNAETRERIPNADTQAIMTGLRPSRSPSRPAIIEPRKRPILPAASADVNARAGKARRHSRRRAAARSRSRDLAHAVVPDRLVTDDLRSYRAAALDLGIDHLHDRGRWKNNRALTAQSIEIAALEIRHDRQNRDIARQRSPRRCRHRTLRCLPGFGFRAAHADQAARFVLGLGSRWRSTASV